MQNDEIDVTFTIWTICRDLSTLPGEASSFSGLEAPEKREEITGPALEGLVYQHLYAWLEYGTAGRGKLYFWRTRGGLEVDFVVYGSIGFWAIEVKNSTRVRPADLNGPAAFKEDYPEATPLLLYRGKQSLLLRDIRCIPVAQFLRNLVPDTPLPS